MSPRVPIPSFVPHLRFSRQSPVPLPEAAYGSSPPAADGSLGSASGSPQGQGRPPAFKPAAPKPPGRSPGPLPPGRLGPMAQGCCEGEKVPVMGTASPIAPRGFSRLGAACKAPLAASPGDLPGAGAWAGSGAAAAATPSPASRQLLPAPRRHPVPGWPRHPGDPAPTAPSRAARGSELGTKGSSCPAGWHQPGMVTGTWVPPGPCSGKAARCCGFTSGNPLGGWEVARGQLSSIPSAGCGLAASPCPWMGTAWWPQAQWMSP